MLGDWAVTIIGFLGLLWMGGLALVVWALASQAVVRRWRTASALRKALSVLGLIAGLFAVNGPFFGALMHYVVKASAVQSGAGLAADGNVYLSGLPGQPDRIEVPRETYVTLYWYEILSLWVPWVGAVVFAACIIGSGVYWLLARDDGDCRFAACQRLLPAVHQSETTARY